MLKTLVGIRLAMTPVLRRTYEPNRLFAQHAPRFVHPNKRLVFELSCPPGTVHQGTLELTQWAAAALPATVTHSETDVESVPAVYTYETRPALWHVNFADPRLFGAYASGLLAQDELQVAEHPVLGAIREALLAEGQPALTETAVLITGAQRRCRIDQSVYGNRFAASSAKTVTQALEVFAQPTVSNLIAIAAPVSRGHGPYWRAQLEGILRTAFTAFAAAMQVSAEQWPGAPVEIRTGFWGCGAFGGNRRAMTLLQLLAARMAGVHRVRFFTFDAQGQDHFTRGVADLHQVTSAELTLASVIERIEELDYQWGTSDGT